MKGKRIAAFALALTMSVSAVLPCSAAEEDTTLRAVCVLTSESFNPLVYGNTDKMVMHSLFDCLFQFESDGTVVPMLAESYEQDGLDVTITLRQDAYFSDGNPVTANDVAFSYNTTLEDTTLVYNMTMWSTGVDVIDDYTITFHLANNYCKWENFLAELLYVVEESTYDATNDYTTEAPVGSGAYTLSGVDTAKTVTLTANESYWGGAPEYKTVEVIASMDDATALVALQTGEVDLVAQVGKDTYTQAAADSSLVAVSFDSWSTMGLMNFVGDDAFRQAVFHAIDRDTILAICNEGNGEASTNMYSAKIMGDYSDVAPFTGYDLELAQECLAESSFDLSQTITISVFDSDSASVAQCIQADLAIIGISVEVSQTDSNTFFSNLMSGNLEMGVVAMGTDMVVTEDMLSMFDPDAGYPFNISDELIEMAQTAPYIEDEEEHAAAVIEMLEQLTVECPWVPLYDTPMYMVYSSRVGNVNDCSSATYVFYFGDMTIEE
ncbi:MAG: ABC transporter substrate-binding protein [Clostridiales bacterium]|nr:ABC transporter substrate-binding protein [Clostridiales bacterium]